jgi:hypothetical protein
MSVDAVEVRVSFFIGFAMACRPLGQSATVMDEPLQFANASHVAALCERRCR